MRPCGRDGLGYTIVYNSVPPASNYYYYTAYAYASPTLFSRISLQVRQTIARLVDPIFA